MSASGRVQYTRCILSPGVSRPSIKCFLIVAKIYGENVLLTSDADFLHKKT